MQSFSGSCRDPSLFVENQMHMSRLMRKPKNQQSVHAKPKAQISAFVFATWIVHFLYFLNPKFPASDDLLCLYSSVSVRPGRKPHFWLSHETAHIFTSTNLLNFDSMFLLFVCLCFRVGFSSRLLNYSNSNSYALLDIRQYVCM